MLTAPLMLLSAAPAVASHDCSVPTNWLAYCGFETGDFSGWVTQDIAGPFIPLQVGGAGWTPWSGFFTSAPTEGSFAAFHGVDGAGPGTIEIFQDTTLGPAPFLRFNYRASWDLLTYGASLDRTFEVVIEPVGGGAPLHTELILTAAAGTLNPDTGDVEATVDLRAFAGMSVRVKFSWTVPETSSGPAFFQLDNVLLWTTFVINNGDPSNRLDIAVLGDGYTAAELSKFASDVDQFMQGMLAEPPYDEYAPYINVHRIEVTSNQSGADHPEDVPPVYVDTALDAAYNCAGTERLVCVNDSEAISIAASSLDPDERDVILVLVNDLEYGGSGGSLAVASTSADAVDLVLHETGHSFGLLADEYGGAPCGAPIEPSEPNATKQTVRAQIKWNHWIDASTPIPTTSSVAGVPGLYQGAKYCDTGLFRPTYDSMMRSIPNRPFEQVNSEQLVKRIYNWLDPIDAAFPDPAPVVDLYLNESQLFEVTALQPTSHDLVVDWYFDYLWVADGVQQYLVDASALGIGDHYLEAVIYDNTPLVRNDPTFALEGYNSWDIAVPEPSVLVQLVSGCLGLFVLNARRRRRR